jgi:hypothetical protein
MSNDRYARYGAASGIVFLVLFIVGFLAFVVPSSPNADASGQEWASFYTDHQNRIQFGIFVVGVGLFFFIWFLGSLRSAIAAAEGGTGRLASIAYAGGLLTAAFFLIAITVTAAAAYRPQEVDPNLTRALNDIAFVVGAPAAAGVTALFAATAIAGYRYGALPAQIAGLSALAAVTQPLAYGVAFTDSGVFAPDGAFGLFVPLLTFVVGILAISGTLTRQPTAAAAPGARPPAGPQ